VGSITAERNELYVFAGTFAIVMSATGAIAATAVCSHAPAYGSEYVVCTSDGATATASANRQRHQPPASPQCCFRNLRS